MNRKARSTKSLNWMLWRKEPAMSEFKVGDWVKRTDKITESIYQISSIDKDLIKCNFIKNGENWRLHTTKGEIKYATPEEIAAGHRIDKPSNPRELETLDKPENHISPNCKVGMFEMDKCREEFEKQRYWIGLFRTGVDFDVTLGEFGRYISNGTKSTDAMDLESFNEKWEAWANCWQHQQAKVEELKASHHGEVIGHEVHFKKIKQERDELQTLYIQQGINMLKLQKRVDKALELMQKPVIVGEPTNYVCARFKELERALKGEGQ